MNGLYRPTGMVGSVVLGLGAAYLADYVPVNIPYKNEIAAFVAGGVPGAAAALVAKRVLPGSGSSASGGEIFY